MMAFGTASTSVALLSDDPIVCVAATATAATTFTTGAALDLAGGATEFSGQLLKGDFNSSITTGFGEAAGFAAETYAETKGIPKKAASVIGIAVEESTKAIVNEVQNLLQDDSKSSSNPKK
jgi:hypothetical protein